MQPLAAIAQNDVKVVDTTVGCGVIGINSVRQSVMFLLSHHVLKQYEGTTRPL